MTKNRLAAFGAACATTMAASSAWAQEPTLDTGNTAWMLTSSALVLLMTLPGLALFYGGLVRSRNVLSVLMQCLVAAGVVSVVWVLVGYSLAFSGNTAGIIGDLAKFGLSGIKPETLSGTIPEYVFAVFQGMFAVITPALMLGAFAERMRFSAYLAFITAWVVLVYSPLAHMVWGGGMIGPAGWGAIDFAGGLVVHMSSGFSALVAALYLGKRQGFRKEPMPPHNLPFTVIGAALLWVGWFGFNAGSELAADGVAGLAFITTNTATAAAVLGWMVIEWLHLGKPTVLGGATAAVAGLVAITPACASVTPLGSIAVGLGSAVLCYGAVAILKPRMGYDDSLDVFGVHGVGGTWGALATGLFLTFGAKEGWTWLDQVLVQLKSVVFTAVFAPLMTIAILWILRRVLGDLRVDSESEAVGLDLSQHSETAYASGTGAHVGSLGGQSAALASAKLTSPVTQS
jgi:Amt family ammonium transporter